MSSNDVVRTVSKKLKYYFEIKRREDGFDLSGPACPKLDHPPTKARPTLMYDGLHDRPLKHYFSPRSAKVALTQFKVPDGQEQQQTKVKKKLVKNMQRYQFVQSTLPDTYYRKLGRNQKILRPETIGFGVQLKRSKTPHKGSYPVLRSTPPDYVSRGEVHRLINMATKLLVATETVDLKGDEKENTFGSQRNRPGTGKGDKKLPNLVKDKKDEKNNSFLDTIEETKKPKYTYDIHGRRVKIEPPKDDDSSYGTRPPSTHNSYVTIDGDSADDKKVPYWLKEQMRKQEPADSKKWVRPHSAEISATHKSKSKVMRPPSGKKRPKSAVINGTEISKDAKEKEHKPAQPKDLPYELQPAAWDLEVCSSAAEEDDRQSQQSFKIAAVQTPGELLREYDPMEKVIWDGEQCRYQVHIFTGGRLGASTKADVKIILCGDNGRTEELWLQDSKNHLIKFQKEQEDIFDLETFYVGALRKISLGHDRMELGYGWFVDRVFVKDRVRRLRYEIPCDKWLSAKEGDGTTIKEFDVRLSTAYEEDDSSEDEYSTQEPNEAIKVIDSDSPRSDPGLVRQAPLEKKIESGSHTSVNTIPSESQDIHRKRHVSASSSSSYTTETSSYTSEASSHSEDENASKHENGPQLNVGEPIKLTTRKDDFFDQNVPDRDYASVIESLSDEKRDDDFAQEHYSGNKYNNVASVQHGSINNSNHPNTVTLTLKGVTEEDEQQKPSYSYGQPEVKPPLSNTKMYQDNESESDTARLSVDTERTPQSKPEEDYMEGFKAGIEAARVSVSESSQKLEDEPSYEDNINKGSTIHTAAKTGDLERVKLLVAHNPDLKSAVDEKGLAPLHISSSHGKTEVVQWLSVNVTDIDSTTPTGYTPIHLAAMKGHTNVVMVLAAMGAQLNAETMEQQTALQLSAMGGHIETVKWLIANGASATSEDISGRTALDLAEQYEHQTVADFLRTCITEQNNPKSSLSQLRTYQKRVSVSSTSSSSSDSSSDSSDSPNSQYNQKSPLSSKENLKGPHVKALYNGDTDSDSDKRAKLRHDEDLEVKRKLYEEQQSKRAEGHTSFLDSIRDEYS